MDHKKLTLGQKKHLRVIQDLANDETYLESLKAIRKKYKIPENGYDFEGTRPEIENKQILKKSEMNHTKGFSEDLDQIIDNFAHKGLRPSYYTYLENIVLFGIGHLKTYNFGIHPNWLKIPSKFGTGTIQEGKNKRLNIEIYGNTSKNDIIENWDIIEEYKKELPGYDSTPFRAYKKPERNKNIIKIYNSGIKDISKITEEYNKKYVEEDDFDSVVGEEIVRGVINRHISES